MPEATATSFEQSAPTFRLDVNSRIAKPPSLRTMLTPSPRSRASLLVPWSAIQKWMPSLQAPPGALPAPVAKTPRKMEIRRFKRETASAPGLLFVTRTRCPSNAASTGPLSPLPVRVARTAPVAARTIDTELEV